MLPFTLLLLSSAHVAWADSLPLVDFNRMGKVGLAGAFAGLDFFQNTSHTFDPSTSTLLSRSSNGSISPLASTNSGGSISAGCTLGNSFYFGGLFSSIGSTSASNIASYTPSSGKFAALGSNGPNGGIDAVFCDTKNNKVWVGGSFTSPGAAVAVWDISSSAWSKAPFDGLTGAEGRVLSITTNSSDTSLFFAGSFIVSFEGNRTILNSTNNPNVPFSPGATPFSSSLVPIPLQGAQIEGSPSSTESGFSNITNILCPAGSDGPGNTWFAGDANSALITVRDFAFLDASGSNHGTTEFSVTTIPDNTVQTLQYLDPTTNQNTTCSTACPLSTNSSILYQDFLFTSSLSITGVQITLSGWTGDGPGLHILQLLSSGAFASAVNTDNAQSCFAPNPSNTTQTGDWEVKVAPSNIAGTTQSVLVSDVAVGTSPSSGPSITWMPYVSASGDYTINMLVPGCTNLQDCAARTSVQVTVFPGNGLNPTVTPVDQTNTADTSVPIYSGPIFPTTPNFVTTVTMILSDNPVGSGSNGQYEIVAGQIELVLTSANPTGSSSSNGSSSGSSTGTNEGFGFFEWPLASSSVDATSTLSNSTETAADKAAIGLFSGIGGNGTIASENAAIVSVAHHSSGTIFLAGNFTTSSNSNNIVSFTDGTVSSLPNNGLDGDVTALAIDGDNLFVGGSFVDTSSASTNGALKGVALYQVQNQKWSTLGAGVNGRVSSLAISNGQLLVAGNFTQIFTSTSDTVGTNAPGFAVWNISSSVWANSGSFILGSITFVANETSPQYLAGNVAVSETYGASGMVMIRNGDSDIPSVFPLSVQLDSTVASTSSSSTRRRSIIPRSSWVPHVRFGHLFSKTKRQSSPSSLAALPDPLPAVAPAVLAGAFWTNNTSNDEVAIIGGNFSFLPSSSSFGSSEAANLGIYNQNSGTISALQGNQVNGTVRSLLVVEDTLYVGGQFTISGLNVNGFAVYDLSKQEWDVSGVQALQPSSGSSVVVRSISTSTSKANTIIVAGTFAQAGSLTCQAICSLDTSSNQWNALGSGINGEVSSVDYAGSNQETLIAAGSIMLSDNTGTNVAQLTFSNMTWAAIGSGSDIPGPVTAMEVNDGNASSIFAAGKTSDNTAFLSFFDGQNWTTLASTLQQETIVSQLTMVPLQDTHTGNSIIQSDRMLMISGLLDDSSFGNASTALFDGTSFIPYIVSSTVSGTAGSVSSLFSSLATFSFTQRHFLATGIVILISIAISAGVVFLLALIGILWTLFARRDRDDKTKQFDAGADDDDSIRHRPSSLLEHINAATRGTIIGIGSSPFAQHSGEKQEERLDGDGLEPEYAHDGDNYVRADTPSAYGGAMGAEETSRPAHARYSFDGAGEGELPLSAGAEVEVLDDRDHAWWYARDVRSGKEGVVPAAYLY